MVNETQARRAVKELIESLEALAERDPEQEIRGAAVPVLDAVIVSTKALLPDHPVIRAMPDAISPEALAEGEPMRAADALVIARQLLAAIGPARAYSQTAAHHRIPGL